jgi:hypothetical protein
VHNTLGEGKPTSSEAVSTLASGSLVDALPDALGLKKTLRATLGSKPQSFTRLPVHAEPLLSLDVGKLDASATAAVNHSSSVLSNGTVAELGQLLDVKAAGGSATTLLNQLETSVNGVSSTVTDQVSSVLDTINQVLQQPGLTQPAQQTLQSLQAALQKVQTTIDDILANVGKTAVLSVRTLDAEQTIAPQAHAARSDASVHLANLDVLNGLLKVSGFVSEATASATGRPGGATASFSKQTPIVEVGTPVLTATLDDSGLSLSNVQGLPQDVTDQVNAALATLQKALNTLLGTLGVHLQYVPGKVQRVSDDGRYASAVGPEYDITVDSPVPGDGALAVIALGHNTTASVSAAPKTVRHFVPNPQQGALPHTGANLPLIGGGALLLLVMAGLLRRRVLA